MSKIQELRDKIKSGAIKPQQGGIKVVAGNYTCMVDEATFGKGENGNARGMIKVKVVEAEDPEMIGGKFNLYEQTANAKYMEQSIAMWAEILTATGTSEDKIYDDAEDMSDVIQNIMNILAKLAKKGTFYLQVDRKEQGKTDAQGRNLYYNNIQIKETIECNTGDSETKTGGAVTLEEVAGNDASDLGQAIGADKPKTESSKKKQW
jgi:hypothetical protein